MDFDWRNPDYAAIYRLRSERLVKIRRDPGLLAALNVYYKGHIADFINDWGCTIDPRLVERGLPATIPFLLFPKQREWVEFFIECWKNQSGGLSDKSRDWGLTWLAMATSCALCHFYDGMAIGFGSRKEEYVDRIGDDKSLLQKGRRFLTYLPREFRGPWDVRRDAPHMRINFPHTGSRIAGEAGDNIGRGDRTSIYVVDEAAYLERPERVEFSLSQTTNCRFDISSAHGMANPFAEKRHASPARVPVMTCHWRDDPRKDDAWYAKQVAKFDPVTVAQEIDINYSASLEGVLLASEWIEAAIDAHKKLNFAPSGAWWGALDVADEGRDLNAFAAAHGPLITHLSEWSGKGSDILSTVETAFDLSDSLKLEGFTFDGDGLGAGVRGDARALNEARRARGARPLTVKTFQGSEAVDDPQGCDIDGKANEDAFMNRKAQGWWSLRIRFLNTWRAIHEKHSAAHDDLISIPSDLPLLSKLRRELSQPTYRSNPIGKFIVNKTPDGALSPNLADAVMILFSGASKSPLRIPKSALEQVRTYGRRA